MRSVCRILDAAVGAACAALLVGFTTIILVDVVCRYWLRIPIIWAAELTVFLFQVMCFLGAGLALRRGMHFGLGVLVKRLWPPAARVAEISISAVIAATSAALLILAIDMAIQSWGAMYTTLPFTHALIYVAMGFSAVMMVLFSVEGIMEGASAPSGHG